MPNLQILMWEVVASHDSLYPKEIWHLQKKIKIQEKDDKIMSDILKFGI